MLTVVVDVVQRILLITITKKVYLKGLYLSEKE